tara:strand:- start:287 stop:445 length:159 start_codon:yes stop_codon:yes gene_type:complete
MIFVMVHYKGSYDKLETAGHEPTTLDRSLYVLDDDDDYNDGVDDIDDIDYVD